MVNLTPSISFGGYTLQLAGGKLLFYGTGKTKVEYNGSRYEVEKDIGFEGSMADPDIVIRHQIDEQTLKIHNSSRCEIRVVGQDINIPPRSRNGFDIDFSETDYISIRNPDTGETLRVDVEDSDSEEEETADNSGLADTLLEQPYSDQDDTSELSLSQILEDSDDAELIGSGSYRLAFRVNPSKIDALRESDGGIVKVAMTPTGTEINKQEMQTWQAVKGSIESRLFCPVTSIGSNHKYIVMREAQNINSFDESVVKRIEDSVVSSVLFDSDGCEIPSPCTKYDINSRNIGTYGGTAVLIDYPYGGSFELASEQVEEFENRLAENL